MDLGSRLICIWYENAETRAHVDAILGIKGINNQLLDVCTDLLNYFRFCYLITMRSNQLCEYFLLGLTYFTGTCGCILSFVHLG